MTTSKAAFRWWALSLLFFLLAPLYAQEKFGALYGTYSDETGAVLPGVTVTLTNKTSSRVISTTTGPDGSYFVRNVEPGRYSVRFELPGFAPTEFPDIDILVGRTFKLDAKTTVVGVQTTVEVIDVVPLIDTQSATVSHHVLQEEFDRLPKSRAFEYLVITAPGANAGEIEGGIQINGASGAENVFTIDGITTQSPIDGRSRQNAVFEYLQEIQVKTAGVEPEYSGALGGVISAVTKSGGNAFHGNAWGYYTGDALSAVSPKRLVVDSSRVAGYQQDEKNRTHQFEPGFSLGGPIKGEMVYFFTSWSPRWDRQQQLYRFGNGAETGAIKRERTFMSAFNKISFDPTPRVRGNLSWLWTPTTSRGTLLAYDGACANCISTTRSENDIYVTRGFFAPQSSYTGNVDVVLSQNVLLSGRGGYFWDNYKDTGINENASLRTRHDLVTRVHGQVDVNFSGNLGGFHNFKAGYGVQKTVNSVDTSYPVGYVLIFRDQSFTSSATGRQDRGAYGYYEVHDRGTIGSAGATMKSVYVQDQWSIHDRLTISGGVRLEHERIPSFRPELRAFPFEFSWIDKLAPRAGASWNVYGDGKLKLSGSWGRFHDTTKYEMVRRAFGGERWRTYYRSLDTLDVSSLNLTNMPGRDLWNPGVTGFRDQLIPNFGPRGADLNIKPMSQDQWSLGGDYRWNTDTVMSARFVHQTLRRTIEDLLVRVNGTDGYMYGNPGEGFARNLFVTSGRTEPPLQYPIPVRTYDAVEITVKKRFSNNWFGDINYTWSRLYGNYAGLANSDEIRVPATGVSYLTAQQQSGSIANPGGNTNRAWDLDEVLFDSKGNYDLKGRLATDRPHALKLYGGYEFGWRLAGITNIGGLFYIASGTPLSTQVSTTNQLPVFVNGRGDLGRTEVLNFVDLQIAHKFNLTESQTLQIEWNMLNAFNQKTSRHRFDNLNRGAGIFVPSSAINLSSVDLRAGYDYEALIRATPDGTNAFDPRYGMDDLFNSGFAGRLALKWSF